MGFAHFLRGKLRDLDVFLLRWDRQAETPVKIPPRLLEQEIKTFLRGLDAPDDGARIYRETHMERVARTVGLVPPPSKTKRVLELGAYMQMTPALQCVLGFEEVRGAYYGPLGRTDEKSITAGGKEVFHCYVDLFNAERDRFPYPDEHFDAVLACEIFEHLLLDPMFMLFECMRVLIDGGTLVLTTPNIASFTSVGDILGGRRHPQLYSQYPNPFGEYRDTEIPHVREYTPYEVREVVEAAGFEIEYLFTEKAPGYNSNLFFREILERNGYPTELRGEQTFCVARKRAEKSTTRYPSFLYDGC
jgi:SAM-dependent methyltransferase